MLRQQAFKFELIPDGAQELAMRRFAGSCRFVYNKALEVQQASYAKGGKYIRYETFAKSLTHWRSDPFTSWLKIAPYHCLQQALRNLDAAYKNFFAGRAKFPTFKHKHSGSSFKFPDAKQFKLDEANARIFLPKLGWLRYRKSRTVLGLPKNITVSQSGGKWFASIQTEREVEQLVSTATASIGIDVGIVRFATMSDGIYVEPLSSFKRHEARLRRYQRRMSRKVKFSSNWHKAKAKVTRCHSDIANARKDFLHKITSAVAKANALVCIEDLQIRNMSKSASGTQEQRGTNVSAKSGLNKSILDQGWLELRRQLQYKLIWNGGMLVAVPAHHSSQTCPCCGHAGKENRQTQAKFLCVACGYINNADVVGAINVLERGQRLLACGEDVRHAKVAKPKRAASMKQEPTEVTRQEQLMLSTVGIPVV